MGGFSQKVTTGFAQANKAVDTWSRKSSVQVAAGGFFAAISAGVVKSVSELAKFEDAMVGVQKTTGASSAEIAALGDSLRQMATVDLQGTVSANTLAGIAEAAGQLGIKGSENILAFTNAIAEIDVATDLSAEQAATSFAQIENVFRKSLEANGQTAESLTANIGSAFNELSNNTTATVSDITESVRRMGGTATEVLGLTVADVAGIAATLRDAGVEVEVGGTAMSKLFLKLANDSDNFAAQLKINASDLSTALKDEPVAALQMVFEGMQNLKNTEGPQALTTAIDEMVGSDTRLTDALLKMSGASEGLTENIAMSNEAFIAGTSAHEEFLTAASSTQAQMAGLQEKSNELFRNFGEGLKPATELLITWGSGSLDTINTFAQDWNAGLKDQFFDQIVAQAQNTEGVVGLLTSAFQGFQNTIIAYSVGIGYAFDQVVGAIDFVKRDMGIFVENVKTGFNETVTAAEELWQNILDAPAAIAEAFAGLKDAIVAPFMEAKEEITGAIDEIKFMVAGDKAPKLDFDAQGAIDELTIIRSEYSAFIRDHDDLDAKSKAVWRGMQQAIDDNREPSDRLKQQFIEITQELEQLGYVSHGGSVFPDMATAIEGARITAEELQGQVETLTASVSAMNTNIEQTADLIREKQNAVRDLDVQIRNITASQRTASKEERAALEASKVALQNKRAALQNEISDLRTLQSTQKATYQDEKQQLSEISQLRDESLKSYKEALQEQADLEEQAYQKLTDVVSSLSDEAKEYVLTTGEGAEALREQGILLDEYDQTALERIRLEEESAQVLEDQVSALESMVTESESFLDTMSDAAGKLGKISSGLSKMGDTLGIKELGQAGEMAGKAQELMEIPKMAAELVPEMAALAGELHGVYSAAIAVVPQLATLGPIAAGAAASWAAWEYLPEPLAAIVAPLGIISKLFKETKSTGTKAREEWIEFVNSMGPGFEEITAGYEQFKDNTDLVSLFGQMSDSGQHLHSVLNGFSDIWLLQSGSLDDAKTGLDRFAAAIAETTGEWEKAPQLAAQMIASMDEQGLSLSEQITKMAELMAASFGTSEASEEYALIQDALADKTALTAEEITELEARLKELEGVLASLPDEKTVKVKVETEGEIPALAGGTQRFTGGLALVGERGPEGAIFPGGGRAILGKHGPEYQVLPEGTRVIPTSQVRSFLDSLPVQAFAGGGTVSAAPVVSLSLTITGNTIARDVDMQRAVRKELDRFARTLRS